MRLYAQLYLYIIEKKDNKYTINKNLQNYNNGKIFTIKWIKIINVIV